MSKGDTVNNEIYLFMDLYFCRFVVCQRDIGNLVRKCFGNRVPTALGNHGKLENCF